MQDAAVLYTHILLINSKYHDANPVNSDSELSKKRIVRYELYEMQLDPDNFGKSYPNRM